MDYFDYLHGPQGTCLKTYLFFKLHNRSPQPKPAEISVESNTSAEDTTPAVTTTYAEPPAPSVQLTADSPSEQEDTELLSTKVVSTEIPVLEPTVPVLEQTIPVLEQTIPVLEPLVPISEVEPTPLSPTLTITPPSLQSSQSISDILLTSQQSIPEVRKTHQIYSFDYTHLCMCFSYIIHFLFQNLNGSSSYLQNFDVRPIMAAPVFTKVEQTQLLLYF